MELTDQFIVFSLALNDYAEGKMQKQILISSKNIEACKTVLHEAKYCH